MRSARSLDLQLPPCYQETEAPADLNDLHDESTLGVLRCRSCHRAAAAERAVTRRRRWPTAEALTEVQLSRHRASFLAAGGSSRGRGGGGG
ncbi:unnamed protein product, partial [Heterosigma akashiwo]